ncbi:B3 domain-containing transcription factor VRN1-like [Vicia villosa]|uniref:B3 domain-containing transcription factor VRN1-like n=1 Tax=Vicia villosa TaxID=3911 RepID=UPI00273CC812|nr:B3 domain-containing transcription factor VRN1-like [Vicia villosa]
MAIQQRPSFHRVIMKNKQLRIPKSYVKKYWNGTSNPIFLRLPNGVQQKIFWIERDGDIWFDKNWKNFAKNFHFAYFLTFKFIDESHFKVKIFNRSCLEINYSDIRCVDEVDESLDESEEVALPKKKKSNKRKREVDSDLNTTQPKHAGKKRYANNGRANNDSPYFEVTLKPSYAKGYTLRIPVVFSRKYFKKSARKAMIKFENDMAMEVNIEYNADNRGFSMKRGWKKFTEKYNLKIGDVCKFVMTQDQPLSFSIIINRVRKEKKHKLFSGVSSSDTTVAKKKSVGETSRGRSKGSKSRNVMNSSFKLLVNCLYPNVPKELMNGPKQIVKLNMKGESWLVKVNYYPSIKRWRLSGGWSKFRKDCRVEIGDTCLFELTDKQNMVFDVSFVGKNA